MLITVTGLVLHLPGVAHAEEADNFTCRGRLSKDALTILDGWVNARIREVLGEANRRGGPACDAACVFRELEGTVGKSYPNPVTMIPHSRFSSWINDQRDVERCHLKFSDTIYGAKAYNQVWRYPFNGRIIFIADSIRLAGRTVGLDKIDHFIREGLDHWREIDRDGGDVAASMAHEVGANGNRFAWTESGVKGMSLTGVFAYADLAAGYFGYRFWDDLLSLGRPGSFVAYDAASRRYSQRREFTFADYVNDAWDESLNPSTFHADLAKEVDAALKKRGMASPVATCHSLAALPQARLYVNPVCLPPPRPDATAMPARVGVHSDPPCPAQFNLVSTPSATSHLIATANAARRRKRFAMSSPRRSWLTNLRSSVSASASIIAPTFPSRRPKSSWVTLPAEPTA